MAKGGGTLLSAVALPSYLRATAIPRQNDALCRLSLRAHIIASSQTSCLGHPRPTVAFAHNLHTTAVARISTTSSRFHRGAPKAKLQKTVKKTTESKDGKTKSDKKTAKTEDSEPKKPMGRPKGPQVVASFEGVVTPWIKQLSKGFWKREFITAGKFSDDIDMKLADEETMQAVIDFTRNPKGPILQAWNNVEPIKNVRPASEPKWWNEEKKWEGGYECIKADNGVEIAVGDFICARYDRLEIRKLNEDRTYEQRTKDDIQFGKVIYMYTDKKGAVCVHCRWFDHAGNTLLGETAAPRELVLLSSCDTIYAESILGNINVTFLEEEDREPLSRTKKEEFFCRYHYNSKFPAFEELKRHENVVDVYELCEKDLECEACELKKRAYSESQPFVTQEEKDSQTHKILHFKGVDYRVGDFIYYIDEKEQYIAPTSTKKAVIPFQIGCIREIIDTVLGSKKHKITLKIDVLTRHDDENRIQWVEYFKNKRFPPPVDNRRLCCNGETREIPGHTLEGRSFVNFFADDTPELDKWKDSSHHHFWMKSQKQGDSDLVKEMTQLSLGETDSARLKLHPRAYFGENSAREGVSRAARLDDFVKSAKKIQALDIFAGAGGLTVGLEMSGVIETKWAIELDSSAATAFQRNKPEATVYNQCVNRLLDHAIKEHNGEEVGNLIDSFGQPIPQMPKTGEVDFIYGGPPCQHYSLLSPDRTPDHLKNSLVATYLSYLEHYRPAYFLLENVYNILQVQLGEISMGTAKFILRALTSLGYQARVGFLQAAQYGVPQYRRRVFFWGAKFGHPLPPFPQPTHSFASKGMTKLAHDGSRFTHITTGKGTTADLHKGPHPMVTVGDAISDLPGFEYKNPFVVMKDDKQQRAEEAKRAKLYPLYNYHRHYVGDTEPQKYGSQPLSEFQRFLRKGVKGDDVTLHYTTGFIEPETVQRIVNIPIKPDAQHDDLPLPLLMDTRKHIRVRQGKSFTPYGRLDYDGVFPTATTGISLVRPPGKHIHPYQRRIISVREYARAQGFPDNMVLYTDYEDMDTDRKGHGNYIKQIGNAVPVPVGKALGDELRDAMFREHQQNEQRKLKIQQRSKS